MNEGANPSRTRGTRASYTSFWGLLCLLLCAQCASIDRATRVTITLDAAPELRSRIAHVDLAFYTAVSPDAFRMRAQERLRPETERAWPLKWSFARSNPEDVRYSLEAVALDSDGKTLASLRASGMFRDEATVDLPLIFDTSCKETCGDGRTCRAGACVDAEIVTNISMVGSSASETSSKPADAGGPDSAQTPRSAGRMPEADACSDDCGTLLRDLTVEGATLDPSFDPRNTRYTLTTGLLANQWRLMPVAAADATLSLNGEPLSGDITPQLAAANELVIEVSGPQGESRQYKIELEAMGRELSMVKADTPTPDSHFGTRVALSGDTMVVTAMSDDSSAKGVNPESPARDGAANSGAAYVFRRRGAEWHQEAYIKASDTSKDAELGKSIVLQGDTLILGAWKEAEQGAVYVYQREGTTWRELEKITAQPRQNGSNFGQSLALLGDVLVIGAGAQDVNANDTGAVHIYRRGADLTWTFDRILSPDTLGTYNWFGSSVSMTDDYLVVGSTGEGNGTLAGGAAYVFRTKTFELIDMIKPSSAGTVGFFGEYTAVVGDTIVISSFNNNAGLSNGTVYVYAPGQDGKFEQKLELAASNAGGGDQFGTGLALTQDYLLVGAAHESSAAVGINGSLQGSAVENGGAAYLFARSGAIGFRQIAHIKASEPASGAQFGCAVAIAGSDIAITADSDAHAASGSGAVYLFR